MILKCEQDGELCSETLKDHKKGGELKKERTGFAWRIEISTLSYTRAVK
jgi:hypothetical protein